MAKDKHSLDNSMFPTAEKDYINSSISIEGISKKYEVPIGTARSWHRRGKWSYKRKLARSVIEPTNKEQLSAIEIFSNEGLTQVDAIKEVITGMKECKGKDKLPFIKEYRAMTEKDTAKTEDEDHAENVTRAWEERERKRLVDNGTLEDAVAKALIDNDIDDAELDKDSVV